MLKCQPFALSRPRVRDLDMSLPERILFFKDMWKNRMVIKLVNAGETNKTLFVKLTESLESK